MQTWIVTRTGFSTQQQWCNKMLSKALALSFFLSSVTFAADITGGYVHLGFGTVSQGGENMVGEMLILGGIALIYIVLTRGE